MVAYNVKYVDLNLYTRKQITATAVSIFPGSNYRAILVAMFADSDIEIRIFQLVRKTAPKVQQLYPCFRGQAIWLDKCKYYGTYE